MMVQGVKDKFKKMARIYNTSKEIDFKAIIAHELDCEGRTEIRPLGYYKVNPGMFRTNENKDAKGGTFYEHILTEEGFKELEKQGLNHPGRGWVSIKPISASEINELYKEAVEDISSIEKEKIILNNFYYDLIGK